MGRWSVRVLTFRAIGLLLSLCPGLGRAEDFNRTLIHYFLTSGQNVRLEIERSRGLVEAFLLEEWEEAARKSHSPSDSPTTPPSPPPGPPSVFERHIAFFRFDYLIPKKSDDYTFLFGTLAYASRKFLLTDDIPIAFYGGFTTFDIQQRDSKGDFKSIATFFNFLGGLEGGWKDIVSVEANLSFNSLLMDYPEKKTIDDFDQAGFSLSLPFLGPFGTITFDLGDKRPRDMEVGWTHSFRRYKAGILTLAYGHRFSYPVTGIAVRNDLDPSDRFDIPGDKSFIMRWERVAPFGSFLEVHSWVALGNVPDVVRHAWGGVTVFLLGKFGLFGRGGTAWSRLDRKRFGGGAGGLEMGWVPTSIPVTINRKKHMLVPVTISFRLLIGYRDPDIVDRLGDVGRATTSATFHVTF